MHTYVAPNPTVIRSGVRHSGNDVSHWSFLFFDIDPIRSDYDASAALDSFLTAFGGWAGRDLYKKSPTIIDSGRGIQVWLRMDDRELQDNIQTNAWEGPVDRKIARRAMGYWLKKLADRIGETHGCRLDTSCSDLPRVMRVPSSINIKTGKRAVFLKMQEQPFNWLSSFLISATPNEILYLPEVQRQPDGTTWQMVFGRLTLAAQTYLQHGHTEPGRHKAMFATAKSLNETGISREATRKALIRANALQGEEQMLPVSEIDRVLDNLWRANVG